jgi:hypothetical protein
MSLEPNSHYDTYANPASTPSSNGVSGFYAMGINNNPSAIEYQVLVDYHTAQLIDAKQSNSTSRYSISTVPADLQLNRQLEPLDADDNATQHRRWRTNRG